MAGPSAVSRTAIWRTSASRGTLQRVDEELGIYREEVMLMLGALADITSNTRTILSILEDEEEDDEEEEADS